jgi:hypothetical protein
MKMDQDIAAATFPAPLDIADLVAGQFSLGMSQIFGVPENGFIVTEKEDLLNYRTFYYNKILLT